MIVETAAQHAAPGPCQAPDLRPVVDPVRFLESRNVLGCAPIDGPREDGFRNRIPELQHQRGLADPAEVDIGAGADRIGRHPRNDVQQGAADQEYVGPGF
jgi:hypothetical protein